MARPPLRLSWKGAIVGAVRVRSADTLPLHLELSLCCLRAAQTTLTDDARVQLFYRWSGIFGGGGAVGEEFAVAAKAAER